MTKEGIHYEFFVDDKFSAQFNKIGSSIAKTEDQVKKLDRSTASSFDNMSAKTGKLKEGIKSLAMEFPLLSQAIRLATSPLGMAAIAIVGIGAALHHGVQKAKEFDHTFLELKNLNLDKTTGQMDKLRDTILDLSFEKGLDPVKTAQAFLDVQGGTGKFGKEVEDIVGKIGVFSMVMKMDFNEAINGAVKAMAIFGFGSEEMDDYLASSAHAVNLGIVSFKELAKVQTEFAGAAGASGQGYDAANKIFAVFSLMSKSADIGATYTKGFFEDLTKLEKIDIDVFKDDGSFRVMDDILSDVNTKFKKLNDQSISKLIEKVGGNEGLRGMLKQVQLQGDSVLQLFEDFDNQEFDFDKALENARGDLETMTQIVDNKLSAAWIRLGDTIMPILVDLKSWLADALDWAGEFFTTLHRGWMVISGDFAGIRKMDQDNYANVKVDTQMEGIQGSLDTFTDPKEKMARLDYYIQSREEMLQMEKDSYKKYMEDPEAYKAYKNKSPMKDDHLPEIEKGDFELFMNSIGLSNTNTLDKENAIGGIVEKDKFETEASILTNKLLLDQLKEKKATMMSEEESILGKTDGSSSSKSDSIAGVSVAGAAVRHVTVNIENLVRDTIINASTVEGGLNDLADKVVEIVVRAVRDAELTISSD